MLRATFVPQRTVSADDILAAHRRLLTKWRGAMDLVGSGPLQPHFEDAAFAVANLECSGDWADLGSGAGFPGIALAANYPLAHVLLVERRQKRATFLRTVIAEAGLSNATVFEGDSDALVGGSCDGVISRAYKPPELFLADCARLLRSGGTAVVLTAGSVPDPVAPLVVDRVERYRIDGKDRASVRYRSAGGATS